MDQRVIQEMLPFFDKVYGNASSKYHQHGRDAAKAVIRSRRIVADLLGAGSPEDVIFTSGATESIVMALGAFTCQIKHCLTSQIEHHAVLQAAAKLEDNNVLVSYLAPTAAGEISIDALAAAIEPTTQLISIMAANNETGVINDIEGIGEIARENGSIFHTDATQYIGKTVSTRVCDVADLVSCSSHKFHGPKGMGVLIASSRARNYLTEKCLVDKAAPFQRNGTANVPGIVGLAKALEIASSELSHTSRRISAMSKILEDNLEAVPGCVINGKNCSRIPGVTSITCVGCDVDALMTALDDYALSSGSACNAASQLPSHVLQAMGLSATDARSTLRISIGKFNSEDEVVSFCKDFRVAVASIRGLVPQPEMCG